MVSVSRPPVRLLSQPHADVTASLSQRHPDKNKDPGAEDMFIKITKSYEVSEKTKNNTNYTIVRDVAGFSLQMSLSNPDPVK